MGSICTSTKDSSDKKSEKNKEINLPSKNNDHGPNAHNNQNIRHSPSVNINEIKNKFKNSKNYIRNLTKETLIKKILEVEGEQIILENCVDCTIIVLDFSAQVTIEKCNNCNIFIGPCKSNIFLRNSQKIRIIASSQQFRARDCSDVKLSLFVMTKPAIEDCSDFQLGCFNFDYTGMIDIFQAAELNYWDNQWSEFNLFSGPNINYFDALTDEDCFKELKNVVVDQEVAEKNYLSIPFTYGLSYDYKDSSNLNCIVLLDSSVSVDDLMTFCDPKRLQQEDCYLIKTFQFKKEDKYADEITKFNRESNSLINSKELFIGLWIVSKNHENFLVLENYTKHNFDGLHFIMFEPDTKGVQSLINKLFDNIKFK